MAWEADLQCEQEGKTTSRSWGGERGGASDLSSKEGEWLPDACGGRRFNPDHMEAVGR